MEVMQHIRKIKAIIILFIMSFLMTDIAYAQIGNLFESVKSIKESIKSKKEKNETNTFQILAEGASSKDICIKLKAQLIGK